MYGHSYTYTGPTLYIWHTQVADCRGNTPHTDNTSREAPNGATHEQQALFAGRHNNTLFAGERKADEIGGARARTHTHTHAHTRTRKRRRGT